MKYMNYLKNMFMEEIDNEVVVKEHKGFMGFTHWLQTNAIFMLLWLIPSSVPIIGQFSANYLHAIDSSTAFLILNFMILGGACLMPDLDSSPLEEGGSTAVSQLGILGIALSTAAITISHVVYSVLKLPGDDKPKSAHRMLWHTFLVPIVFYLWVCATFSDPNGKATGLFSYNGFVNNTSAFILLIIYAIAAYMGIGMAVYRFFRLINKRKYIQIVSWVSFFGSFIAMINMPFSELKLLGTTLAIGYFLHVFEDLFSQGSSPALFPIPIPKNGKFQLWFKGFLPFKFLVRTGGLVNKLLDYVFISINAVLIWIIFVI